MLKAANFFAGGINDGFLYLRENAWSIVGLLALWFFLKPRVISAYDDYKISAASVKYDQDLRRVRELQQLQAEKDARRKALEAKQNPPPPKPVDVNKGTKKTPEARGGPSLSMQTFASHSYKPVRRTVRRG